MRSDWRATFDHLEREISTLTSHQSFDRVRKRREALAPFTDPAALFDHLHGSGGDPEAKNRILAALIREAQSEGPEAGLAVRVLHLALWPGLDAVHRRLLVHFRRRREELASEISARCLDQIARLDLDRVSRIAATITRNIERDVNRGLQADWREAAERVAEDVMERLPARPSFDEATDIRERMAALLTPILGSNAAFMADIVALDLSQKEAAAAHGLSHEAARKRYQRAMAKLRAARIASD